MSEPDLRFRHLEKKIGFFVLAAIGLLAVAIVLVGVERDLFRPKYELVFTTEKGTGFSRGMPVKLSGFRIGRIRSIELDERAMVEIRLQIDKRYQHWIKDDSTVRLVMEGLIGDSVLEVSVGSADRPPLPNGGRIAFLKTKGLEEQATEISEKLKPVLLEVRDIIHYVNDDQGDIKQTLRNLHSFTGDLQQTRSRADRLLATSDRTVQRTGEAAVAFLAKAEGRLDQLEQTLVRIDRLSATLDERLPSLLTKADETLGNLQATSAELKKAAASNLPTVPPLLDRAGILLEETENTVKAAQQVWPLRSHIPPPGDLELLPGDSHD